jgi:hypothetical protein
MCSKCPSHNQCSSNADVDAQLRFDIAGLCDKQPQEYTDGKTKRSAAQCIRRCVKKGGQASESFKAKGSQKLGSLARLGYFFVLGMAHRGGPQQR